MMGQQDDELWVLGQSFSFITFCQYKLSFSLQHLSEETCYTGRASVEEFKKGCAWQDLSKGKSITMNKVSLENA